MKSGLGHFQPSSLCLRSTYQSQNKAHYIQCRETRTETCYEKHISFTSSKNMVNLCLIWSLERGVLVSVIQPPYGKGGARAIYVKLYENGSLC